MKAIAKLVLALATVGSCAGAVAAVGDQADQERRARNREEAIANWERTQERTDADRSAYDRRDSDDHRDHRTVGQKARDAEHSTEAFTHRQLNKMRRFGERQEERFHRPDHPVREDNKRSSALGK